MDTGDTKSWPCNAWYVAAWADEVAPGGLLARTYLNQPVVLFRDEAGAVHALEDRCCHRATPLRLGEVVPEGLQCGYHGLVFDGGGRCVAIPGQDKVPPQARVRSYPVVEQHELVWIWMGDPALANPDDVIPYPWNDDHENWPHFREAFQLECSYLLLIDNLMDLSHIPFIHRKTIGGGVVAEQVNARMDVEPRDNGVRFVRWMFDIVPPPTFAEGAGWPEGTRVDRWAEQEFIAPSTVRQWSGALEVGRGAEQNREQSGGFNVRIFHSATPETERTCHYFWSPANGYRPGDPAATRHLHDQTYLTYQEDVAFLHAQQAELDARPDAPTIEIKADIARLPARRAVERMIRAEAHMQAQTAAQTAAAAAE